MDGPIYHGVYLGFCTVSKPPTSVTVLQSSLRELYLKFRRVGSGARSASLKLIQHGILISLYEEGLLKDEIFFNYSTVTYVEAVKFSTLKTSSERKPKAFFLPVDESKGVVSDKHAFLLDKSFHFLVSSSHPPLLACVVRRPKGVKALDCHVFALDTIENALHITSLIMSSQVPPGFDNKGGPGAGEVLDPRSDGQFNRGARGDVIRTDHGDYNFYRGHQPYDRPHNHGDILPQNIPPQNVGPGDMVGGGGGGVRASANFQRLPPQGQQHQYTTVTDEGYSYGLYQQPRSGALIAGPIPRRSDLSENRRQGSFEDNRGNTAIDGNMSTGSDRSFGVHHKDDARLASRHSTGYQEPTPTAHYIVGDDPRRFPHSTNSPSVRSDGVGMGGGEIGVGRGSSLQRPMPASSQLSPRLEHPDGPIFSASNLESRARERVGGNEDIINAEQFAGGKPVAKVPPHLKGVKVLPSDFRMVKLKHKVDKRSDSSEESQYDNNNEIMTKYKAMQEHERIQEQQYQADQSRFHGPSNGNANINVDYDKEDTVKDIQFRHVGKNNLLEYPSPRNRYSAPVYADSIPPWGGGTQSHSSYNMGGGQFPGDDNSRVKDAEIASMFSNMRFQGNTHSDFEQSLGYLP